jgi:hypothetical protein
MMDMYNKGIKSLPHTIIGIHKIIINNIVKMGIVYNLLTRFSTKIEVHIHENYLVVGT